MSTAAPLTPKSFLVCLTSLCPSVETATVLSSFICNKTPVSAGFSSSRLIAKEVELIICFNVFPGILMLVGDSCTGVFGNSSGFLAIRSYCPRSVDIVALFLSSTSIVSLTSGSSLATSRRVFNGIAAWPLFSRLDGISTWIEISKSVVLRMVFSSLASIRAHPKIGNVDLVGVALDVFEALVVIRFWMWKTSYFLFVEKGSLLFFIMVLDALKIPTWLFY